jgi:hypothetical protein
MKKLLIALAFASTVVWAQPQKNISVIACAGTPGSTIAAYRQQCQTAAGAVYACNNASGCAVPADWVSVTGSGSFTYPGAGVPKSTGGAWDTSYAVGTGANNLVQLNGSSQLPAVSAALLTNFPTLNQNTSGTAAGLSATLVPGSGGTGVANTATLTLGSSNQNWATLGTGIVKNTTTTGALSNAAAADLNAAFGSQTQNYVYASPNGSSGTPSFRAIVAADIPTLNQSTSGTAAGLSATLAVASGGTGTASTLMGLVRGSASAMTAAELSGDATTSGSNAVTVVKVNGTTVPTNSAADQTVVTTASATGSWASITNCGDATHALGYSTATHTFGCQAITASATAGGSTTQLQYNNATALGGVSGWTTNGTTTLTSSATGVLDMHAGNSVNNILLPGAFSTGLLRVTTSTGAVASAELSGDVSTSGSNAVTVTRLNGTSLSSLGTGILKNTTGTGVPSIAIAADFPTLNQDTSGTAAKATNLAAGTVGQVPYQTSANNTTFLAANTAATDQVVVSHGTGAAGQAPTLSNSPALSAANMTSFPTLNQDTTGTATKATNLAGGTVGQIPYQNLANTTLFLSANTAATDQVLVSHGTGAAGQAPTLSNAPALSAANMTSFPTLNQNTSGTAAGLSSTLAAAIGGTGVANTATLTLGSSNQNWATLGTGLVKNTTTTGALSNPTYSDVVSLWTTCGSNFLKGDGTCASAGGTGTVTSSSSPVIHQVPVFTTATDIKGITVPSADSLLYGTTATDPAFKALPTTGTNGCSGSNDILQWNNSTHAFACGTVVPGTGTVTVVSSGSLTSTAIVTGGGTTTLQTPSATATVDASGNVVAHSFSTSGGSTAGYFSMPQGTANTPGSNSVGFQAPASVPSSFLFTMPSAPAAGLLHATNATPSVLSTSAVVDADLSGAVGVAHGGTALTTLTAHALYAGNTTSAPTAIGPDASTTKALFSAGPSADPAFRAIASTDLPTVAIAQGGVNATSAAAGTIPNATSTTAASWTATPTLGAAGTTAGSLTIANSAAGEGSIIMTGHTSGTVTVKPQATAGTPSLAWPTASGTLTASASAPIGVDGATGAISCSTCVVASSPGVGLAHFAGSTQTVTSSLVAIADISATGTPSSTTALFGDGTWKAASGSTSNQNLRTIGAVLSPANLTACVYVPYSGTINAFHAVASDGATASTALVKIQSQAAFATFVSTGVAGTSDISNGGEQLTSVLGLVDTTLTSWSTMLAAGTTVCLVASGFTLGTAINANITVAAN